jgi:hypothetical protein
LAVLEVAMQCTVVVKRDWQAGRYESLRWATKWLRDALSLRQASMRCSMNSDAIAAQVGSSRTRLRYSYFAPPFRNAASRDARHELELAIELKIQIDQASLTADRSARRKPMSSQPNSARQQQKVDVVDQFDRRATLPPPPHVSPLNRR